MNLVQLDRIFPAWAKDTLVVRSKEGGFVPFLLNAMQQAQHTRRLHSDKRQFIVLKARQLGSTTYELARHIQAAQMTDGFGVAVVALKGDEGAVPIGQTLRDMVEHQADVWKRHAPKLITETDTLLRWANGSRIQIFTQGGGNEVGRSQAFQRLHCTELAKWDHPALTLAAAEPAIPPAAERIYESTANGFNYFEELWREATTEPDSELEPSFYPWWIASEYRLPVSGNLTDVTPEEAALIAVHALDDEQIAFRRARKRRLRELFKQEFAESADECFIATGDSVFPFDLIDLLQRDTSAPILTASEGIISRWEKPYHGVSYVVGADGANGVPNGDMSAAVVLRADTGEHVETVMCNPPYPASRQNRLTPNDFARVLTREAHYYNDALIMCESNEPGGSILTSIKDVHNYPAEKIGRWEDKLGFRTHRASKVAAKTAFVQSVETRSFRTPDARVPKQMANMVVLNRNALGHESIGARQGTHDDLLMAAMIANIARSQALAAAMRGPAVIRWR